MSEELDIKIHTPSATYTLQWKESGARLMRNAAIIAHGFRGEKITEEILREAVEKVFDEIRTMVNRVLPVADKTGARTLKELKSSEIPRVQDVYFAVRCPKCGSVLTIKVLLSHAVAREQQ